MASKVIALVDLSSAQPGTGVILQKYKAGEIIGDFTRNLNNGTIEVNKNAIVETNKVAIMINSVDSIAPTKTVATQIASVQDRNLKIRKIISLAILGAGAYFLYQNKKAVGITLVVTGLFLVKRNFQK
jgi:ribosomal protein S3